MVDRTPSSPPHIEKIASDADRPFWSVMIPAYNCSAYLKRTLQSVLIQDPGMTHMQIEVVDDASTDADVEQLVRQVSGERVAFYRQPHNVGSLRNFETCINRARGQWVHLLHGDDKVAPGFYEEMERMIKLHPEAGAVFCHFNHIDEQDNILAANDFMPGSDGILPGWLSTIAQRQRIQPPAIVVKREVYERLGSFFGIHYGEDWIMWVRIAAHWPFAYTSANLASYRVHANNITSASFRNSQHIKDIRKAISIIRPYLPVAERKELNQQAKRNWSLYFARTADMTFHKYRLPRQAVIQARLALMLHPNRTTLFYFIKMIVKSLIRYKL